MTCDIREPEQIAAAFDTATEAAGLPGVLVNNAAANFPVPAEDMSPNAWRTVVKGSNGRLEPRLRIAIPRYELFGGFGVREVQSTAPCE